MTGIKTNAPGNFFWLRLVFVGAIFKGIIAGSTAVFAEWAKTDDWVLEYRYWIIAGTYLMAAAVGVGLMYLTHVLIRALDKQEASRQGGTRP